MGKIADEMTPLESRTTRLQHEIRHTEDEISETLHSIEDNLSPSRIKAEMQKKAREKSLRAVIKTTDGVKKHPAQAAIIGAGAVGLLMWSIRRKKKKKELERRQLYAQPLLMRARPADLEPRKKRNPLGTMKKLFTVGQMLVTVGSVLGAALLRSDQRESTASPPCGPEVGTVPVRKAV